jgi:hypothetical protein
MKRTIYSILVFILFAFPTTALADVAPPYFPPGSNPQPGAETTQVRMVAETVLIQVQKDIKPESLGSARITADFTMHNLGAVDENMAVRFPISAENGRGEYPEIGDIAVTVNGKQILYRRVTYPDTRYQDKEIPWTEFEVKFPSGIDTAIQVSYTLRGTGYPPYTAFYYILETGAGWIDTIGSADIILRLPYPVSPQNVVLDNEIGWATTTRGATFLGNEARWHFENFEPGADSPVQNMEFALVSPVAWNAVLTEREQVSRNTNDGEAWGRLGRAYKQIFLMGKGYRTDPGGEELYRLSIEAYEKCLSIKPDDAQWHAGFADLLVSRSYWDAWGKGPSADTFRGLNEIHTALELAPDDPKVQEIATNIRYMFPDGVLETANGYDFPWLTQTPTSIPPTPTIKPAFDPEAVSGIYKSALITFSNNKKAQLTATLNPDHSARLETSYKNDSPMTSTASWMDNGDGTLILTVTDPIRGEIRFVFKVDQDRLRAVEYPAIYGDAVIEMVKLVSASSLSAATNTPMLAALNTPEPTVTLGASSPSPSSPPSPKTPICGSAALIPMVGIILGIRCRTLRLRH